MAEHGCFLVPTIGVTHDVELMLADGWPDHARLRAAATAPGHAEGVLAAVAAGVKLACGADLNPIGPRLHAELAMLERIGIDRRTVLHAATSGGRELLGLGDSTRPGDRRRRRPRRRRQPIRSRISPRCAARPQ